MASIAEKILQHTNHPRGREVADHVASGLTFGQILAKYNLTDAQLAKVHQYKSSIQTALKMGTPFQEVVDAHFPSQNMRNKIMSVYHAAKAS